MIKRKDKNNKIMVIKVGGISGSANSDCCHSKMEEYVGNRKRFTINSNNSKMLFIGNENRIYMNSNSGSVDVVGNSTRLKIHNNTGRVNFIGNDGRIILGYGSDSTNVVYTGNNGGLKVSSTNEKYKKDAPNYN